VAVESRLVLEAGPDAMLSRIMGFIFVLAIIGFVFSPASLALKFIAVFLCILLAPYQRRFIKNVPECNLVVFSNGRIQWNDASGRACEDSILCNNWVISRYAMIRVGNGRRKGSFLVSRSLQTPGSFQQISSWLRLGSSTREQQGL
jgi:hypothetical protein